MSTTEQIAEAAAERALVKFAMFFGVDVDDPESIRKFNMDLGWVREMREAREKGRDQARHAFWLITSGSIVAILGAAVAHFWPSSGGGH